MFFLKKIEKWYPAKDMLDNFKMKCNCADDYLESVIEEYKKFIQLAKKNKVTPSTIIDEFWHFHILNTEDYFKFCDDYIGRYLHHTPSNKRMQDQYIKTLQLYYDTFGKTPNEQIWPRSQNFSFEEKQKNSSDSGFFSGWFGNSSNIDSTTSESSDTSFWGGLFGGGGAGGDWGDSGGDGGSGCGGGGCGGD